MDCVCSTYRERRGAYRILVGRPKGRNHLEDPGVDGRTIFKSILKKWDGGMDWFDLAQDKDRWRALVSVVTNLWVPLNSRNFFTI